MCLLALSQANRPHSTDYKDITSNNEGYNFFENLQYARFY